MVKVCGSCWHCHRNKKGIISCICS